MTPTPVCGLSRRSPRGLYLENAPVVTGDILHINGGQSAGH
jgi:hypothetical protein